MQDTIHIEVQYGPPTPEAAALDTKRREVALHEIWQLMTDTRLEWAIWPNGH